MSWIMKLWIVSSIMAALAVFVMGSSVNFARRSLLR